MMARVPQNTLNWLSTVLRNEYRDPNRAYSDIVQTLAQYPGLSPRTDVYTSDNGIPALLLNLKGTLPVSFRGTVYQFPVALWIPHAYPYEAPLVYVTPTDDMVVRPGQHVSSSDGRVYHHYLAKWRDAWDRSNIIELLKALADIFAREPPVMAKTQQLPMQQQQQQKQPRQDISPPVPRPPPDPGRYGDQPSLPERPGRMTAPRQSGQPPPPPPKQSVGNSPSTSEPSSSTTRPGRYDAPPPLPREEPLPYRTPSLTQYSSGNAQQSPGIMQQIPQRPRSFQQPHHPREQTPVQWQPQPQPAETQPLTYQYPPGQSSSHMSVVPTAQPNTQSPIQQHQQTPQMPPVSHTLPHQQQQPLPATVDVSHLQQTKQYPANQPQQARGPGRHAQPLHPQQVPDQPAQPQQLSHQNQPQHRQQASFQPQQRQSAAPPPPSQARPTPVKDLLSEDDPFQVSLSTTSKSEVAAPPIPVNPEKTALLSHISHLILQRLHESVQQAQNSALPSLYSQHAALTAASQTLANETHQLQSARAQLQSNVAALQTTIAAANQTIQSTRDSGHSSHADNIPPIDQIIIPPTVVARQLYDAVAEQRGYEAAIFALNEAFVRGRVGAEVWGRKVRECAREEMRRKWLVKKIGEGLGLEDDGGHH